MVRSKGESNREFTQVTGKVFEFNQNICQIQQSQFAESVVSAGSIDSSQENKTAN